MAEYLRSESKCCGYHQYDAALPPLCYGGCGERGFVGSRLLSAIVSDWDKTMKDAQITG